MDFTLTETPTALRDLADRIIGDHAEVERVRAIERQAAAGGDGIDRDLWRALARAGVLQAFAEPGDVEPAAAATAAEVGVGSRRAPGPNGGPHGTGDGVGRRGPLGPDGASDGPGDRDRDERPDVVAAATVCEVLGRHVVPVPLWPTLAALLVLREAGVAGLDTGVLPAVAEGRELITVALAEAGQTSPAQGSVRADVEGRLTGDRVAVPAAPVARWALVPVGRPAPALHLVDLTGPGVTVERVVTTDRALAGHVRLADAPSRRVGDEAAGERLRDVATVLVCALQVGACAEAVRRTGAHLMSREQFGRPLAGFQGPVLRIADAHIDTEAMRVTTLQAAWRLETRRPAAEAVATAKWWAAEAGHRVVHATQHLHGGIGADVDYPVHRYFLWAKQLGDTLGGASAHAAELGRLLAAGATR